MKIIPKRRNIRKARRNSTQSSISFLKSFLFHSFAKVDYKGFLRINEKERFEEKNILFSFSSLSFQERIRVSYYYLLT